MQFKLSKKHKWLLVLNFIAAFMLLAVYMSPYVNPSNYWWMGAIAFLYPTLLITNFVFLLYWAWNKNIFFALSFFMILVGYRHMTRVIAMDIYPDEVKSGGEFKVLSYNVKNFDYHNFMEEKEYETSFKKYFTQEQADVICFQELFSLKSKYGYHYIDTLKKHLDYHFQYLHTDEIEEKHQYHGINILSKYPIIQSKKIAYWEEEGSKNGVVYADIQFPDIIVRIYNVHLQSIQWGQGKDFKKATEKEWMSDKLSRAYDLRVRQMNGLIEHAKACPYPIVIAGDYNEPPLSYIYSNLKKELNLSDAFLESGIGFGSTINSKRSLTRIDYILVDSALSANQFNIEQLDLSDHLPMSVNVSYEDGE